VFVLHAQPDAGAEIVTKSQRTKLTVLFPGIPFCIAAALQ
jgi:hypothetical protein